jgi:sugar/nucleoside kinase (ribokinase family)
MIRQPGERPTVGAFGMLTWDQILTVASYPEAGTYRIVQETIEQSGGTTGNMAVTLARLGVDVSLASRVGDDVHGQRLLDELAREGCKVEHVEMVNDEPTDRGVIIVSGAGVNSDRTIYWIQGARLKHGHHLPIEEFFARDLVVLDVDDPRLRLLLLDLPMHVSPRTRIFGTMTYLVEVEPAIGLDLALRHDYLAGNVAEISYLTGCETLADAVTRFQREMVLSQVRFAAISDGAAGCLLITREEVTEVPAFTIDARDPTGAGDAFAAGIAYAILKQWDLNTAGRFANAMGALATRELGARTSLSELDEVNTFLESASVRTESPYARSNERN